VETRASTDIFAVADADVTAALRFIEDHAGEMITVEDVVRASFATRRMLERKFKSLLRHSPRERILRAHLEQSKRLLIHTGLSMLDVALHSGFPSGSKFSAVFKREIGVGPSQFRRLYGSPLPGGARVIALP
jgi:LacI family transcriptional regulator